MNSSVTGIAEILTNVVKEDLKNFDITVDIPAKKGDGYLGDMVFVNLRNKISNSVLDLVVKCALTDKTLRDTYSVRAAFTNEINLYTKVWPSLNEFQQRLPESYQFQKLAKCFAVDSANNSEKIVLENLKCRGYELYDKKKPLDKDHFELILKEYGKLHALSFAFKASDPKGFSNMIEELTDTMLLTSKNDFFRKLIKLTHETCLDSLQPGVDDEVIKKYDSYRKNCQDAFYKSLSYETKFTVVTHGDCWSNNMMFKYNETGRVADVRFLDFQMAVKRSPCFDLSYCIYSGATKDILDNLDYYLLLYHESLSKTLDQFGYSSEQLYPFNKLKEDWKQCSIFGFILALLVWRIKLSDDNAIKDLQDIEKEVEKDLQSSGYDAIKYREITRNLILHMYNNDLFP